MPPNNWANAELALLEQNIRKTEQRLRKLAVIVFIASFINLASAIINVLDHL